jgi:Uma2 family endonuclease
MGRQVIEPETIELPRLRMSYQEFLDWSGDTTHAEWVAGEVIVFMPPVELHQLVKALLVALLERFVNAFDLGVVLDAPYEMRLPDGSSREPDILFLSREHFDRRTPERLIGPADAVWEILSKSTARYDRGEKFDAYLRNGVPECWFADPRPRHRRVEAFTRTTGGRYEPILPDDQGRIRSIVLPGFWLKPEWLWQDPLPKPDALIAEIAPVAYKAYLRQFFGVDASNGENPGNGSSAHR